MFALGETCLVNRLYNAYVALAVASRKESGSRTMPLARFRAREVRLVELPSSQKSDGLDLWIELYDHEIQSSLDSCRCPDLDEGEPLVEHLICRARDQNESDEGSGSSG
jgi:hypothetical protein